MSRRAAPGTAVVAQYPHRHAIGSKRVGKSDLHALRGLVRERSDAQRITRVVVQNGERMTPGTDLSGEVPFVVHLPGQVRSLVLVPNVILGFGRMVLQQSGAAQNLGDGAAGRQILVSLVHKVPANLASSPGLVFRTNREDESTNDFARLVWTRQGPAAPVAQVLAATSEPFVARRRTYTKATTQKTNIATGLGS